MTSIYSHCITWQGPASLRQCDFPVKGISHRVYLCARMHASSHVHVFIRTTDYAEHCCRPKGEKVEEGSSWRNCNVLNYKANNRRPSLLHDKFLSSSEGLLLWNFSIQHFLTIKCYNHQFFLPDSYRIRICMHLFCIIQQHVLFDVECC